MSFLVILNIKKSKEKEEMAQKAVYSQWVKKGTNTFIPTDNSKIVRTVDPGVYDLRSAEGVGIYMFKKEIHLDELLIFPNSVHQTVLENIKDFWTRRDKFKEYNFAFKRGLLLHGPAGSGKSSSINIAMKHMVEDMKGVVITLGTHDLEMYIKFCPEIFRVIEPERPIFIIMEDLEGMCRSDSSETALLNVLDGLDQLENVIYVATTNYIEQLKARIINRPSRFDRRIYVGMPSAVDREYYFTQKLKPHDLEAIDVKEWVKDTEGMSVAHLAELIKSVVIMGNKYQDALQILQELNDTKNLHSNQYEKSPKNIGFITGAWETAYIKEPSKPIY